MSSGEWIEIQSALTEAVSGLRTEVQSGLGSMRTEMQNGLGDVRSQLVKIHGSLASGETTMRYQREELDRERQERKQGQADNATRLDEHSDLFKKVTPTAVPVALEKPDRTWARIKTKALDTIISAVVLGALAVAYNTWRDQAIKEERAKEKENTSKEAPLPDHRAGGGHAPGVTAPVATP